MFRYKIINLRLLINQLTIKMIQRQQNNLNKHHMHISQILGKYLGKLYLLIKRWLLINKNKEIKKRNYNLIWIVILFKKKCLKDINNMWINLNPKLKRGWMSLYLMNHLMIWSFRLINWKWILKYRIINMLSNMSTLISTFQKCKKTFNK